MIEVVTQVRNVEVGVYRLYSWSYTLAASVDSIAAKMSETATRALDAVMKLFIALLKWYTVLMISWDVLGAGWLKFGHTELAIPYILMELAVVLTPVPVTDNMPAEPSNHDNYNASVMR